MKSNQNSEWAKEYNDFLNADSVNVPESVSKQVVSRIQKLLNPGAAFVFLKILGIHLVVGFMSLGVCHQFGVNPFGTSFSLDSFFMKWGHSTCMVFCGILFVSLSLIAAGLFLTVEETKVLRRTEFLQALSLGIVSLGIFAAMGAQLALTFAGLWLVGALIGGFLTTEAVWKLKQI